MNAEVTYGNGSPLLLIVVYIGLKIEVSVFICYRDWL